MTWFEPSCMGSPRNYNWTTLINFLIIQLLFFVFAKEWLSSTTKRYILLHIADGKQSFIAFFVSIAGDAAVCVVFVICMRGALIFFRFVYVPSDLLISIALLWTWLADGFGSGETVLVSRCPATRP